MGLDCAAYTFCDGDARKHRWRAGHGESWQLLFLLPHDDTTVPSPAVGRMAAAIEDSSVGQDIARGTTFMADLDINERKRVVTDRFREDSDYVFHELTRSICPGCRRAEGTSHHQKKQDNRFP